MDLLLKRRGEIRRTGRPNILFIYADDQSYRTIGCYPESFDCVRRPNIDSLVENGVRFANASIGTWCMPSRATMLTGHHQFGVESMRMEGERVFCWQSRLATVLLKP